MSCLSVLSPVFCRLTASSQCSLCIVTFKCYFWEKSSFFCIYVLYNTVYCTCIFVLHHYRYSLTLYRNIPGCLVLVKLLLYVQYIYRSSLFSLDFCSAPYTVKWSCSSEFFSAIIDPYLGLQFIPFIISISGHSNLRGQSL